MKTTMKAAILLAWSTKDRLNFKEMRQVAQGHPEFENIDELKEDRSRRILGNYYHGWTVKKYSIGKFCSELFITDPANIRIKIAPTVQVGAAPSGNKIATCKINRDKNGIELYFNSKPASAVLDDLKANGWRWSRFNSCWYKLDNSIARRTASKYAEVPNTLNATERLADAGLVEAQEEAAIANGNY